MNLFNAYQALAFFCATPFGIHWLYNNDWRVVSYLFCFAWVIGFVMIGICINEQAGKLK